MRGSIRGNLQSTRPGILTPVPRHAVASSCWNDASTAEWTHRTPPGHGVRLLDHIYLDLDGTLTDNAKGIVACLRYAADEMGVGISGDLTRFIGPQLRDAFREILGSNNPERIERATSLYRERFARVGIFENEVYPGIPAALEALHSAGYTLAVVTAKPKVYADRIVDHFQLGTYIGAVYGPDLAGYPQTKTELLANVLGAEGASPERSYMIGDRAYDMEAARLNSVRALGVGWGYGTRAELIRAGATAVVDTVSDLVRAIEEFGYDC